MLQKVNERLRKSHVEERIRKLGMGNNIDWATAEALAIGTLMLQGMVLLLHYKQVEVHTSIHECCSQNVIQLMWYTFQ